MQPIETVGLVGGFFGAMASLPQVVRIFKLKDGSAVSTPTFVMLLVSYSLWVVYGLHQQAVSIILWNSIAIIPSALVLFIKWRYAKAQPLPAQLKE